MLKEIVGHLPTIITKRLQLRNLTTADAGEIRILRSNEEVNKFLERASSASFKDALEFINKISDSISNKHCFYWGITEREANRVIGTICLWNIDEQREMGEVGFELLPAFQGNGIMLEALAEVIKFSFENLGLKVITALTDVRNIKSINLLVRCNFIPDEQFAIISKQSAGDLAVYYLQAENAR